MSRLTGRTFLALSLALALVIYWARYQGPSAPVRGLPDTVSETLPESESADLNEQFAEAVESLSKQSHDHTSTSSIRPQPIQASNCSWPKWYRRTDFDIGLLFAAGEFGSYDFFRHVLLNPRDIPACPDQIKDLDRLLSALKSTSGPVIATIQAIQRDDRLQQIRSGIVQPLPVTKPTQTEDTRRVEKIRRASRLAGQEISLEEARQLLKKGAAFSIRTPVTNCTYTDGRWYRHSDFKSLPRYDVVFEKVRYLALDEAAIVVAWFVQNGFTQYTVDLSDMLKQIRTMSPRDLDKEPKR